MSDSGYLKWRDEITGADFETASSMILDKILPSLDERGQKFLRDMYDYFISHYKSGVPVKLDTLRAHMVDVKGNDDFGGSQLVSFLVLMAVCGFKITDFK